MKNKAELISILEKKCETLVLKRNEDKVNKMKEYLLAKYNISYGTTMDYIAQRVNFSTISPFELFCIADGISYISKNINLPEYYSDFEIKEYTKIKRDNGKIKFPIRIPGVKIDDDQFLCKIDVEFLISLRKSSMIKYNVNAQRALQRVVRGDTEYYKIQLNKFAVEQIKDALSNKMYIPNTLTFNIPLDSKSDFYYDEKENEVVINDLDHFDISDGYHRYVALTQLYDNDNTFNYPMELRIVNFEDDKIKQFIFQEDQKTKMTKLNSDSMNIDKASNKIVEKLNNNSAFKGKIGRTGENIDFARFSYLMNVIEFDNKNTRDVSTRNKVYNDYKNKIELYAEQCPEVLEEKFLFNRLVAMTMTFKYHHDEDTIGQKISQVEKEIVDEKFNKTHKFSKQDEFRVSKLFK